MGIEPTRPCGQRILSPQRLPIPPLEHWFANLINFWLNLKVIFRLSLFFFAMSSTTYSAPLKKYTAIPTPHRTFWAAKSLQGSAGVGNALQAGCSNFLFRWRATGMFMYKPWVGGGIEVHQGGGSISQDTVVSSDRYKVFARLHYSNSSDFISFLSPFIGFDNGNVNSLRAQTPLDPELDPLAEPDVCLEPGLRNGYDIGLEYGLGWRYHQFWSVTFSTSISARNDENFQNESAIGLAYDLGSRWPKLKRGANEIFAYGDTIWVFRKSEWEILGLLGVGIGF